MTSKPSKAERPMFVLLVAGIGFFVLSFVAMGVGPWLYLDQQFANEPRAAGFKNPYKDESGELTAIGRGRAVYIAEGCWHCHSQFVRPVAGEEFRYGPRSQAWEAMFDVPHLYGTRRIGPDLAREAGRRSDDWHLAHLWNPRSTVPASLMPSYPWLFEKQGEQWVANEKATDLVAYLQHLGVHFKEDVRAQVWPKRVTVSGAPTRTSLQAQRGKQLFENYCTGCHGADGKGLGLAKDFLTPSASDLTTRFLPREEVFRVLFMGSEGTAMPSFAELTEKDLWAIAQHVSDLGTGAREPSLAQINEARVARGRQVYNDAGCTTCHGVDGKVPANMESLRPAPKHFSDRLYSPEYTKLAIRQGRPGTTMAGYASDRISDADLEALSAYLASLYDAKRYGDDK